MQLNRPLLLQLLAVLEQLRRDAPELGAPNPIELLRWPGLLGQETPLEEGALSEPVIDLFEATLAELMNHRQREGGQLRDTIEQRLVEMERLLNDIRRHTATIASEVQGRLLQRQRALLLKMEVPHVCEYSIMIMQEQITLVRMMFRLHKRYLLGLVTTYYYLEEEALNMLA